MAEDGQLSQMEDSLDRRGLGMDLAERMNTNSQQMNCLAITTELLQGLVLLFLIVLLNMVAEELQLQHQILQLIEPEVQEIIGHTTIFPHIEPVIVGIELPSFIREVC